MTLFLHFLHAKDKHAEAFEAPHINSVIYICIQLDLKATVKTSVSVSTFKINRIVTGIPGRQQIMLSYIEEQSLMHINTCIKT